MASSPESELSFVTRLGLALVEPRWALAVAGDRRAPGRSGSDLLRVMGLALVAGHLRALVVAGWLAVAVHPGLGVRTLGAVISAVLTVPLGFLVISAAVLWLVAGRARNVGRAFDLACVPAVPLLLVLLVGLAVSQLLELQGVSAVGLVVMGLGFGWAGALVTLAFSTARILVSVAAVPPAEVARRGRLAGRAALAVTAAIFAVQLGFVVLHTDDLRPVAPRERAPAFALPEVGAGGALGARWELAPGKRGRVVVLDFWATWCGICLKGLPHLEALRVAHPEVDVVSINLDDAAAARQLFDEKKWGLVLLHDNADVAVRYGVTSLPHLVVIDRDGTVREVKIGHPGDLESLLR